jgi:histidine ammonia-lyase
MTTAPPTVRIGSRPLTVDDVVAVADGTPVTLEAEARQRIAVSRSVVDALVGGDALIYGLNTGLGHMRDVRVPLDHLRAYQVDIVRSHAGAIGPPLQRRIVRAAMVARLAGIAAGGSGASPILAEMLVELLNRGVTPVVPLVGSVGAADLMHMACIAEVMIGEGRAEVDGEVLPGSAALARAGLEPITLEPKDGLAAVSSNGVAMGHAALVVERARALARAADIVVAVSLAASGGNPSIVDPVVGRAKGIAGQVVAADRIRAMLAGSDRDLAGRSMSVQDPLSYRVGPQVHGAFRETIQQLSVAVETELNAMADNPLVVVDEGRLVSNGNFAPMVLALTADALRPAVAHLGQVSDRRSGHLFDRLATSDLLASPEGMSEALGTGGAILRYASAARVAELRSLADPVSLDIGVLDVGVEDHAANAPLAVRRSDEALAVAEDILAIELSIAAAFVETFAVQGRLGRGIEAALAAFDEATTTAGGRSPADLLVATVREALGSAIVPAAEAAAGLA